MKIELVSNNFTLQKEDNQYVSWGQIGEGNKYDSLEEVFKYLQGFDIHLDDIFWD